MHWTMHCKHHRTAVGIALVGYNPTTELRGCFSDAATKLVPVRKCLDCGHSWCEDAAKYPHMRTAAYKREQVRAAQRAAKTAANEEARARAHYEALKKRFGDAS